MDTPLLMRPQITSPESLTPCPDSPTLRLETCATELRHQTLKLLAVQSENRALRENVARLIQRNEQLRKTMNMNTLQTAALEH